MSQHSEELLGVKSEVPILLVPSAAGTSFHQRPHAGAGKLVAATTSELQMPTSSRKYAEGVGGKAD